jgi:hypothetical protein
MRLNVCVCARVAGGSAFFSAVARKQSGLGSFKTVVPRVFWAELATAHGFVVNVQPADYIRGQRHRDHVFITKAQKI